eukprot:UN04301
MTELFSRINIIKNESLMTDIEVVTSHRSKHENITSFAEQLTLVESNTNGYVGGLLQNNFDKEEQFFFEYPESIIATHLAVKTAGNENIVIMGVQKYNHIYDR